MVVRFFKILFVGLEFKLKISAHILKMITYLHIVVSYLNYLVSVLISKSSPSVSFIEQSTSVIDEALTYLPNMVRVFCRQIVNESDVRSLVICIRKIASICASTIFSLQGLFVGCIYVGSGDPVRVLRLLHNKYTGYNWSIYCWDICTTCHYRSYVLLYWLLRSHWSLWMKWALYCTVWWVK